MDKPIIEDYGDGYYWECPRCHTLHRLEHGQRVEIRGIYDEEQTISGCTVQILHNSVTGEYSVGWWKGSAEDYPRGDG